jgi:hypothetical protein
LHYQTILIIDLINHNHGIVLFKQVIATFIFQTYVSHVSNLCFMYITSDYECKMMLMRIIGGAYCMFNTRGVTQRRLVVGRADGDEVDAREEERLVQAQRAVGIQDRR